MLQVVLRQVESAVHLRWHYATSKSCCSLLATRSCRTLPRRLTKEFPVSPVESSTAESRRLIAPASSDNIAQADMRVVLVSGALMCLAGSLLSVYIAFSRDPNSKQDRVWFKRGEYVAGATLAGAVAIAIVITRK
mmetsp:Transcript_58652/g.136932  ORF Transcript_58652/g.136932 Transcript_58652/m.136932 type:complete len:135 (-) Transcript_58652:142-546(-)